jgi:hypothetical protein
MIELSTHDVTYDSRRPLAAEIDKRPLLTSQIMPITNEWYTVNSKHELNINRKPWSTNRMGSCS